MINRIWENNSVDILSKASMFHDKEVYAEANMLTS